MDFARAAALAQRLIEANGRDTVFDKLSATAVDADKPWKGPGSPTVADTVTQKAVFVPHAGNEDLGRYFVDVELMKRCDQLLMTFVGTKDLTTFHRVTDSGTQWRIEWIRELKPGPTSVLIVMGVCR